MAVSSNKPALKAIDGDTKKQQRMSSRGQQRKAKILAAATRLFLSQGYGETSIDAIVDQSGGSKATLYSYYPTKADLFRAVVDSIVTTHEGPELATFENIRETLVNFAEHRLGIVFSSNHRALMRLIIAERARFPDIARPSARPPKRRPINTDPASTSATPTTRRRSH